MMKMLLLFLLLLLLLLALSSSSLGADVTLSSVEDFTVFVSDVNSGTNYSGTTVYLGSDLSLSEKALDPIGNDTYYFLGTFDGQGHTISDLQMNTSSSQYTGLFGYSKGLIIKNVVLDSSCSIINSRSGSGGSYVGGIIGSCVASRRDCNIENSVNMADVAFSGNISSNLFIGGIVGYLYSSSDYSIYVKNCVNYDYVTHSGTVNSWYAELGGIVGYSDGSSPYKYVQNCLNYGTITHNGTSSKLIIGGIVGNSASYTYIENCVSAGKISIQTTTSSINYIGSIVGRVVSDVHINYCYYTSDVNASSINGDGTLSSTTGTPDFPTAVDSDLVSNLNSNATSCSWSKWLLNTNNATVTFKMGDDKELSFSSQVILIPYPVKEGNNFLFWCKDAECTEKFNPEIESVSGTTALYAAWVNNTVAFDFDNGTTVNETFTYNTEIAYPEMKKEGYTLSWDNYHKLMPARDITVTVQWTPNNYNVTFDANGGSVSEPSKIVTFNEKYGNLPEAEKPGYMLIGWFTDAINGAEVTSETIVTIPDNHTLYAHWEEVTNQVEIVFNTKDLSQEDVKELIEQYTKADFEVIRFEEESGEIRVIIKFDDKEDAEEFIRTVKESNRATDLIKKIGFDKGDYDSSSTMIYLFSFLNTLFL